jgi:hypothetical protein
MVIGNGKYRTIMAMSGDFLVLVILVKTKYKWILVQSWFTLCTNVINVMGGAFRLWESISIWECISVMGGDFSYDYVHEEGVHY